MRRDGPCLGTITYDHINRWIILSFRTNQGPKIHNHPTCVNVLSMIVKMCAKKYPKKSKKYSTHTMLLQTLDDYDVVRP